MTSTDRPSRCPLGTPAAQSFGVGCALAWPSRRYRASFSAKVLVRLRPGIGLSIYRASICRSGAVYFRYHSLSSTKVQQAADMTRAAVETGGSGSAQM